MKLTILRCARRCRGLGVRDLWSVILVITVSRAAHQETTAIQSRLRAKKGRKSYLLGLYAKASTMAGK